MRYIADQYTVHEALEDAIFDASGRTQTKPNGGLISMHRPLPPIPGAGAKVQAALRGVAELGLERCVKYSKPLNSYLCMSSPYI